MCRLSFVLIAHFVALPAIRGAEPDYRTPETAITTKAQPAGIQTTLGPAPYLGVHVQPDAAGKLVIDDVRPDSPADKAGVKPGDLLTRFDGKDLTSVDAF